MYQMRQNVTVPHLEGEHTCGRGVVPIYEVLLSIGRVSGRGLGIAAGAGWYHLPV